MGSIEIHPENGTANGLALQNEASLPSTSADAHGSEGNPSARESRPETPLSRILVVEDDIQSQQYMKILLSKQYFVEVASSAADAWATLQRAPVDLVLMDISLHGEIDGLQLTRMIRDDASFKALPVIALTAHAFPADRQKSIDAGCSDYLSKPFQRDQLLIIIEKHIKH